MTYLNPEQRHALTQIPPDLSDRDIARYYTYTEKEQDLINRRRRASNRLGFAVQLALLKFPGRTLMEVKEVPRAVLTRPPHNILYAVGKSKLANVALIAFTLFGGSGMLEAILVGSGDRGECLDRKCAASSAFIERNKCCWN